MRLHASGKAQGAVEFVDAQLKRLHASGGPAAPAEAAYHELLPQVALQLEPVGSAAGAVRCVRALGHDAFELHLPGGRKE
jgi:hypothetical protein